MNVDFNAYAVGLCYASVCTSLPDDEAVFRLNLEHWSGTSNPWRIADEPFSNGSPNGCPCEFTVGNRHLLFVC